MNNNKTHLSLNRILQRPRNRGNEGWQTWDGVKVKLTEYNSPLLAVWRAGTQLKEPAPLGGWSLTGHPQSKLRAGTQESQQCLWQAIQYILSHIHILSQIITSEL